jgi:formate hydrogenlyase transcriptional activator
MHRYLAMDTAAVTMLGTGFLDPHPPGESMLRRSDEARDDMNGSGDHFRRMIDAIPTLAWSCSPDGATEFLNQRWLSYTGLLLEESLGWGWKGAIHPDDLGRLMTTWLGHLASGEPGEEEARLRRFDGEYRWFLFRAVPVRDEQGTVVRWYGTNTDIEDLKRAEEQVRRDEREVRQIVDAIPQAIVVLAPDGRALYGNRAVLEDTGLSLEEIQKGYFLVLHPDDVERVRAERARGLAREAPFQLEQRTRGRDGRYRWFLVHYKPLRDDQGHILRWYATGTDIEHRKRAEEQIRGENLALREEIDLSSMFEEIVGSSDPLRRTLRQVTKVARADSTVLILGETGTGKELIARAIHRRSNRSARAFIRVNCAAIPPALIASELFGHERGAFTGAVQRRLGRFESADGGTIFLDEIGELPMETQLALLRVLQEREFERVGSSQVISLDVRVLAATNRDLKAAVAEGTFRQDLFYRLNVFPIEVPPLRERVDDIPVLVEYLIDRYARRAAKRIRTIETRTMELFRAYDWPGNIRELQNVIERAVILCDDGTFSVDEAWLKPEGRRESPRADKQERSLGRLPPDRERELIEAALAETRGRIAGPSGAAVKLGVPRQTLESKIGSLGINKHGFKSA